MNARDTPAEVFREKMLEEAGRDPHPEPNKRRSSRRAWFSCLIEYEVTLLDQFGAWTTVGSGLVIQPIGLRVLEQIGAAGAALAEGAISSKVAPAILTALSKGR